MKHVIVVGMIYQDTVLSVPHFPAEDSKLRATGIHVRRGGNSGNTLEVLQQLLASAAAQRRRREIEDGGEEEEEEEVQPHLVGPLPDAASPGTALARSSFGPGPPAVDLGLCWHHETATQLPSSYVVRSAETGSRTIVNYNPLPEMTLADFASAVAALVASSSSGGGEGCWWHFEGRIPDTTLACVRLLRRLQPSAVVSVEVEKPGREGLVGLADEADVVFYSRSWAEDRGYAGPEECLRGERPSRASHMFVTWGEKGASAFAVQGQEYHHCAVKEVEGGEYRVVDTLGAGDTFIAGVIFGMVCHAGDWDLQHQLRFAVGLATRKVQIDGFGGLVDGTSLQ